MKRTARHITPRGRWRILILAATLWIAAGTGCEAGDAGSTMTEPTTREDAPITITVTSNDRVTVFELNDSPAAKDLYAQLPLSIAVENYSNDEKIFYPPEKLNTNDTPLADAHAGTLAYYAPWGDVVMFYEDFGSAAGLYELGKVTEGAEYIREMTGTIHIEKGDTVKEQVLFKVEDQKSFKGPEEWFSGEVKVDLLFPDNETAHYSGARVTFQPGARTAWHLHPAGQHLVVESGVGLTGTRDGKILEFHAGDVVWCPAGIDHWHGPTP